MPRSAVMEIALGDMLVSDREMSMGDAWCESQEVNSELRHECQGSCLLLILGRALKLGKYFHKGTEFVLQVEGPKAISGMK